MGVDSVDCLLVLLPVSYYYVFCGSLVSIILLKNNSQSSYICDTEVYLLTDDEVLSPSLIGYSSIQSGIRAMR